MASVVAKGNSTATCQLSSLMSVQEKGSRNKRKFRADPPFTELNTFISSNQAEFEINPSHGHSSACDLCGVNPDRSSDGLKLDLGLSSAIALSEVGPSPTTEELEVEVFKKGHWGEYTEDELERFVLQDLDVSFRSAIRKIVACGYPEEVASKAVLRPGVCYGNKDTISNIVNNTLAFLCSGQDINTSTEHCFENLQQLEKYLFAEQVCVLREVKPFFSTGDAMWNLLITDMNLPHAFTVDGDPLSSFNGDESGSSSVSTQSQSKTEDKSSELLSPSPHSSLSSIPFPPSSQPVALPVAGVPNVTKSKKSFILAEKDVCSFTSDTLHKTFSVAGTSQSPVFEEKFVGTRKVHGMTKREILRQKSLLEKNYRTYGSKGSSRAAKSSGLGSFFLDKKLKPVSDSTALKHASVRLSKAMGVEVSHENRSRNLSNNPGSSCIALKLGSTNTVSVLPTKPSIIPPMNAPSALPIPDTELSLSLPTKSNSAKFPSDCNAEASNCSSARTPSDKFLVQWVPRDSKDETILKLVPRVRELQNQLQEWTEWANQRVMQAARRLGKDKAEHKALRQEKEEVERLKKEKQSLEESTVKKLSDMEFAVRKANSQVDQANHAVRNLEVENAALRQDMEAAKFRAGVSAANFQEVLKREKKTLMKVQSWEKQKTMFQEELAAERARVAKLLPELEQAKVRQEQTEARWQQDEKTKQDLLEQANSIRKERENFEESVNSKAEMIKSKAEINLQLYKDDIQKLEKEISEMRLKKDSSKIAALRRGIDGSYVCKLSSDSNKSSSITQIDFPEMLADLKDFSGSGGVKRERECVMCLSEERCVVFVPCAHQVVCTACNEQHEKQGMKDCPSCRTPIQRRINVRFAKAKAKA
ncbi:putative E3 ubiquitin-protein ligase RF298 [Rutidosis leptorrhynchoides]|uniref:putative E3 ubiquitin-protein ligase RF298 n=1 Tax=Rutidosis leptorrhynchoides TaxID=125765 RepID=UPI003A98CFE6